MAASLYPKCRHRRGRELVRQSISYPHAIGPVRASHVRHPRGTGGAVENNFPVRCLGRCLREARLTLPDSSLDRRRAQTPSRPRHVLTFMLRQPVRIPPADGNGGHPMLAFARGAFAAALVLLSSVPTIAADKQFRS